jgi:protein arginine kinase activator
MHKGTRHIGKMPAGMQQARVLTEKVKALQKKLGKAIEDENFEAAAALRDELKQLSTRIGGTIAK